MTFALHNPWCKTHKYADGKDDQNEQTELDKDPADQPSQYHLQTQPSTAHHNRRRTKRSLQ